MFRPRGPEAHFQPKTWISAGRQDDHEQHRQEEQDHRHGQLRRQRGGLLLGLVHAHVAVFLRHHAQRLAERRAVALRLDQRVATDFTPSRPVRLPRFS